MPSDDPSPSGPSPTSGSPARQRSAWLVTAAAVLVLGGSAAGWLSEWHWLLDLTTHFRHSWFLASVGGLALALALRRLPAAAILAAAVVINGVDLARYWLPPPAAPPRAAKEPVFLVSMNVRRINRETAAAVSYLRSRRPDVAAVIEVDDRWAAALEGLGDLFPHRLIVPRADNFGIAVLARCPLVDARVVEFSPSGYPSIVATVRHASGDFRVIATHPYPPFTSTAWTTLIAHLDGVAAEASRGPPASVVVGDLNATPWSYPFRRLLASAGLVDSALGRGVQATYHAGLPAPRIPIDHVLVPGAATVLRRGMGPANGSDHFPVEAEFILP